MKGYRSIIVHGAVCVLPLVDSALNHGAIVSAVMGAHGTAVLSVLGLVGVVLRWVTTTPVLKSE